MNVVRKEPSTGIARDPGSRVHRFMVWTFGIVVAFAGLGFVYKLYEFFEDLSATEGLRFAGAHLLVYLLVAGGFMCLLGFAFLRGHFSDIEAPKYELIDREKSHDEAEFGA